MSEDEYDPTLDVDEAREPPQPIEDEIPPEPPPPPAGELPLSVTAVWGVSEESLQTAQLLIDGWGLERFLNSEIHQMAVKEQASDARMDPIRKAFVAAQKKKEEKGK